ncbi:MAG: D-alanyl-D-alanine carboxypeptidase/D-alanyl-D-alanine-endopeptidase [Bdellovibrionota bacterium]
MIRFLFIIILLNISFCSLLTAENTGLQLKLNKWAASQKKLNLGVSLVDVDSETVIFSHNAAQVLKPASVLKLVTTHAALEILGPEYQFTTQVFTTGFDGSFIDKLIIKGGADPTFTTESAWMLVREVKRRGIKSVGQLVLDASRVVESAERQGQRAYESGSSALPLNFNSIFFEICPTGINGPALVKQDPYEYPVVISGKISTAAKDGTYAIDEVADASFEISGKIRKQLGCQKVYRSIRNPIDYFGRVITALLLKEGIEIKQGFSAAPRPKSATIFTELKSKPLAIILRDLNHYSTNFTAEQILLAISEDSNGQMSRSKGLSLMTKAAKGFYQDGKYQIADASGLSHENRISSALLTKILLNAAREPSIFTPFIASLSHYGRSGTLKNRHGVNSKGIFAKTGTINNVRTLAGYAYNRSNRLMAFAMLQNNVGSIPNANRLEDEFLNLIVNSQ